MTVYQVRVSDGDKILPLASKVYSSFEKAQKEAERLYETTNSEFSKMKGTDLLVYEVISLAVKE